MKIQILAVAAGVWLVGSADVQAQSFDRTSLVDHNRAAVVAGAGTSQSPGTVGAMNAVVSGLATSSEDVRRNQLGRTSAADGNRAIATHPAAEIVGQSPGTVGAMPGN